ncbi:hypothetical protein ThrDRAFT_03307 [Frankia casuarinae]|uniref:hypothetical protein n=1 Tax=Frankia TaxID=1854 RepID=UPI0003CFA28B|nr:MULTISPECIES: hypothetical protein [Frankia]KFB05903.1 hypothetical protein ALLO2DRAFT_01187 [Frankia sp. Allo2]ETA00944.1 hypothetical protein CcI6DRAFT_03631 [Frankia sp. CcI6]EYT91052.1 hypothetical protein ThrDRAFT_03307 [Frankia casuarinae]KDA41934.1 hypothetical protein BMG523Draft_03234 [Frankia sp. BMG5.23]OAA28846.1 hypothetical protein AAY23_101810 [Frankia casuarinae]
MPFDRCACAATHAAGRWTDVAHVLVAGGQRPGRRAATRTTAGDRGRTGHLTLWRVADLFEGYPAATAPDGFRTLEVMSIVVS